MALLLDSLAAENHLSTAIVLAFLELSLVSRVDSHIRERACQLATLVRDDDDKNRIFVLMAVAGMVKDCSILREVSKKNIEVRHLGLAELLVNAGVILDDPNGSMQCAVDYMNFDLMNLLRNGCISAPIALALSLVPESASESELLRILDMLRSRGIEEQTLDTPLIRAMQKRQAHLAERLMAYGGCIEFESGVAVHIAFEHADLHTLEVLLTRDCSLNIMSSNIPTAMGNTAQCII